MPAALSTSNLTTSTNVTLVNKDGFTQLDPGIPMAELEGRGPAEQVSAMSPDLLRTVSHVPAQMVVLNEQLTLQNRIKEGAENLLIMPLAVCCISVVAMILAEAY